MFPKIRNRRSWPAGRTFHLGVECLEDRRLLSAETLINLDLFRADPRFSGIDGSGQSTVIIDTGVDADHPFFGPDADGNGVADRIKYQWDFADNDANAHDSSSSGHGSHVASIVASNSSLHLGMAPGSGIIILKVFPDAGTSAEFEDVEAALQWVEANVSTYNIASVNLSLGSGNFSDPQSLPPLSDEFERLAHSGVIVTAATGNLYKSNDNQPGVGYPAADPNVLAVGAVWVGDHGTQSLEGAVDNSTAEDRIAAFSQRDPQLTNIFAPGGLIPGANRNGGVTTRRGTSMAAPHISGIAALAQQLAMREMGRRLTPAEFRDLLISTGDTIHDGDDEDDNVTNTGADYRRVDVLRLGEAILAEPGLPSVTVNNATVTEGDVAGTEAVFTVRLSFIGDAPVAVGYTTVDGTATLAGGDYLRTGGVLTFSPGGPLVRQIVVPITGDVLNEADETVHLELVDALGANIARARGTATILDDDEQLAWHNPVEARDVNHDNLISGLDALIIINELNTVGPHFLPQNPVPRTPWYFYDVSNDGLVSALDALIVINWLNAQARVGNAADGGESMISENSVVSAAASLAPATDAVPSMVSRMVTASPHRDARRAASAEWPAHGPIVAGRITPSELPRGPIGMNRSVDRPAMVLYAVDAVFDDEADADVTANIADSTIWKMAGFQPRSA